MNRDIRNIYQVDYLQKSPQNEKYENTQIEKTQSSESRFSQIQTNHQMYSKESLNSPSYKQDMINNGRSQSHNNNRNTVLSRDPSFDSQGEGKKNFNSSNKKQSVFQLREQVDSQLIRMTTSSFLKRQSQLTNNTQLASDSKSPNSLQNHQNCPIKFSKYMVSSKGGSYTQSQLKAIMNLTTVDSSINNQKIENDGNQSTLSQRIQPMSLSYKNFQQPYFSSRYGEGKLSNSSLQFPGIPNNGNHSQNSIINFNNSSNLKNNMKENQFQRFMNINENLQKNKDAEESSLFGSQYMDLTQISPTHRLSTITSRIHPSQNQNFTSPKGANTTANTFSSRLSHITSPQLNFFITESPMDNFSLPNRVKPFEQTGSNESNNSIFDKQKSPKQKTNNKNKLKNQDLSKLRKQAYFTPSLKPQNTIFTENRMSLQEKFHIESSERFENDKQIYERQNSQYSEEEEQKSKYYNQNKNKTEMSSSSSNSSEDLDINNPDNNSSLNKSDFDKKSDQSFPFKKGSLIQNMKDRVYYQKIMSPLSTRSQIQDERQSTEKQKLKFFQKLKKIEKIQQENEFDKVKIRNLDLETVSLQNQLKEKILPFNLNKFYKENKLPQKTIKNINQIMEKKKQDLYSTQNSEIKNSDNQVGIEQNNQELQSQKSDIQQQKSIEGEGGQKRIQGINYQGLQDEEKIKEMEEYLESDKFNETFYANNQKIANILKQKKARRSLKQVFMKNNRINNESLAKIVQNLPLSTKQLDLSCNQINHLGSKYVTDLLNDNAFHNLEYLNVSKNMIGDIGAIKILEATVSNNFLKILDISSNKISHLCAKLISKLLNNNQYLDELYLGHNTLQNESLNIICDGLLTNSNIKVLDLQYNSLGGSDNPQKFYGKKLIKIINNKISNMKHLDLSFNRFQKAEALEIATELQENFYLYGFHFEGNPCNFIVNARGFIVENNKPIEEQGRGIFTRNIRINDFQNISEIYKDNFYKSIITDENQSVFTNRNYKPSTKANQDYGNSCKSGEVCWICDGYKEIKFTFKLNYKIDREPIYIHLSFEGYEPFRMDQDPQDSTKFFIHRMCPPNKKITYFFSNPFINQISILPYNQIRSETFPINLLKKNFKRLSIKNNQNSLYEYNSQDQVKKTIVVDYTDIKGYVIHLPELMNVYKQNSINNQNKNKKNLPFYNSDFPTTPNEINRQQFNDNESDTVDSAQALINQINQIGERKKEEYQTHINHDQFEKNNEGEIIYIYKKNLGNILNDNYDPLIRSIIRQIQKPFLEQASMNKGQKKNGWNVKNSIFAEFRGDDYLFLKNCFEFDWQQSKLNKMIRSEDDREDLKQLLFDIYPYIKNTYKQLASQNMYGDVFAISSIVFSEFISQTKIIDGKLMKLSDVDFNFIATNAQKEKNPRNPERALIRFQFMEVLVRIAFDKYIKNKTYSTFSEAFKQVLNEEDLLKELMVPLDPQKWRETRLWTPQCDTLIRQKLDSFKTLYEKWAGSRNKEKKIFTTVKVMCCSEFKDFIISNPVFGENITEKELNQIFSDSMMTQIDEVNKDRYMQMQLIEFIEAFGRISDKISPVPSGEDKNAYTQEELIQLPLHMKIESIISQLDGNKGNQIQSKSQSRSSLQYINQKELSMPRINSKVVLDQKSIPEIVEQEVKIPSQIKIGFKGFMLAKSLKKKLIGNKIIQSQPKQTIELPEDVQIENLDDNLQKQI